MAKADRAEAYEQLPPLEGAVATLQHPKDELLYGSPPEAQLFGSASLVSHYNLLSRLIALLDCRYLEIL